MTEVVEYKDNGLIQVQQTVVIEMPSGNAKLIVLKPNTMINLGKFGSFQSDFLIGKPFGLSYEIISKQGEIRPVVHVSKNSSIGKYGMLSDLEETAANNQLIIDDSSNQKLTHEQVLALKEKGLQGELATEEIIKMMVNSHSSFSKKTEYSKAKYIERKKKKFMKTFTPVRPTINTINDYFISKNPEKIKHMRIDTLSQLLSMANVRANSKLLVVDDTQGLIVSSCLERMGGYGQVVAIHEGDHHNYDLLRYMNLSKSAQSILYPVPMTMIDQSIPNDSFEILTDEQVLQLSRNETTSYGRRKAAWQNRVKCRKALHDGNFDGLIVSSSFQPETVIKELMQYVNGSRPVVVYSFNKEALLQTAYWMRRSRDFLNAELTESSMRQYQVLPGRMHPNMNMSCGGGYLLSALRVIDCPFDPSLVKKSADDGNDRRSRKKKCLPAINDGEEQDQEQEAN
ncbi:Gcd10p family-domain-containing protein [Parasitella parasitica]|nr:Gcd10p family-domain-containing protein [Parasitella parasitica]